jgi:hypothetical protein
MAYYLLFRKAGGRSLTFLSPSLTLSSTFERGKGHGRKTFRPRLIPHRRFIRWERACRGWLLTGRGESPLKSQRQEAVYSSWNNLLRKLDLPADLEAHLREVPRAIERFDVLFAELSGWLPRRERPAMSVPDEQLRDYRKLAAAWTANVARKIEQNGIERVRAAFLHSAGRTMAVGVPSTAIANSSIATAPKTTPKRRKQ